MDKIIGNGQWTKQLTIANGQMVNRLPKSNRSIGKFYISTPPHPGKKKNICNQKEFRLKTSNLVVEKDG